jgi:hypothetical protein
VLTVDGPPSKLPVIPSLPVKEYPFSFDDISFLHLQHLAQIQRYDAYFSRDFFRATGLLMAMRDGGKAGHPTGYPNGRSLTYLSVMGNSSGTMEEHLSEEITATRIVC